MSLLLLEQREQETMLLLHLEGPVTSVAQLFYKVDITRTVGLRSPEQTISS